MSSNQIDSILQYLKRSFYLLFLIVIFIVSFFIFLVYKSYLDLNKYSETSSLHTYHAVYEKEHQNLRKLIYDYAYWTSAAEAVTGDINYDFIDDSYDGEYLNDAFALDGLAVYNLDGSLKLTVSSEGRDESPNQDFANKDFKLLFEKAIKTNYASPTPASSFINFRGKPYFVSASAITPSLYTEAFPKPEAYGVLVMIRPLDEALLTDWESHYSFHHIKVQAIDDITPPRYLSSVIKDPFGHEIYKVVWEPDLPGLVFIRDLLPTALVMISILAIVTILFVFQLNNYIRLSLTAAHQLVESRDQLHKLAHYDSVTHLPNRLLGMDRLSQALSSLNRNKNLVAVFFVDLDDFKPVNDKYGHDVGDKLLAIVAQLLESCVRQGTDTVSRLGGDEFIIILSGIKRNEDVNIFAEKIMSLLTQKIEVDGKLLQVGVSIGVSITDSAQIPCDEMIKKADNAMYKAKGQGKNRFYIAD